VRDQLFIRRKEIMNEMPVTPVEEPKKNNTPLIIGIVVVVLLCCCCAVVAGGWFFGDQIVQSMNF
jgi:hypothetical protein